MVTQSATRLLAIAVLFTFTFGIALTMVVSPAEAIFGFGGNPIKASPTPKASVVPSPKPTATPTPKASSKQKAQKNEVKGAKDQKKGESVIAKFFKSIGRTLAAVGDFLWPFEDMKLAKKDIKKEDKQVAQAPVVVQEAPSAGGNSSTGVVLGVAEDLESLVARVASLELGAGGTAAVLSQIDSSSVNIIRNSSFEVQTDTKPRQWNYILDSTIGNTMRSDEGIHSGKYGLKFKGGGTGNFGVSQPETKTTPQNKYNLSTYIKVVDAPSIVVKLGFWNQYTGEYAKVKDFAYNGTRDWIRIDMNAETNGIITDTSNWYPLVQVTGLTSGAVYIDDVQLSQGGILVAYNSARASTSGGELGDGSILGSTDGSLFPAQNGIGNLGASHSKWEDLFLSDDADIGGSLSVTDSISTAGDVAVNGDDLTSDGNLTIAATGYVRIGDTGTPGVAASDDELYVLGDIESDGNMDVAGNLTVTGTFTSASGSSISSDSLTLTPSTDIDALNLIGTNVAAADLIDLNGDATTTGDGIDISMANTRTSGSAILITDVSVAATVTGDLVQINVTGTKDTNTVDIDVSGAAVATGNEIDITYSASAHTGNAVDLNMGTNVAGDAINIATAATTGNAIDITTSGVFTNELIDINLGAQASTGDVINIAMGATAVDAQALVITNAAGVRTANMIQVDDNNSTGTVATFDLNIASTRGGLFDIDATGAFGTENLVDIDTTAAFTSNLIDITTATVASSGNLVDLNFGNIADTGDAINISMGAAAVGAQGLVMSTSAGIRTASAIALTENNTTGTVPTIQYDSAQTRGGFLDLNATGVLGTENLITIDASAAFTSNLLDINTTAASSGNVIDITTATVASSGNLIDLNFGNIADTGDAINISMGAAAVGAQGLVLGTSAGIRTASAIAITENNTTGAVPTIQYDSAQTRGGILDANLTGALGTENAIDIDTTADFTSNIIDITAGDGGVGSTGNLIDLNFSSTAHTGDAINISMLTNAVGAQALVITTANAPHTASAIEINDNNSTGTVATFDLNLASTRGGLFDIDTTGAFITENLIDITTGAQAWTSNILDINVGAAAATGDVINIALGASAPAAQALVVTGSSSTATGGVVSLAIDTVAAQSADVVDITSTVGIMDGTDTFQGIDINITGANHTGASNVITGIDVALTTPDADATEIGISVNTNWDLGISSASGIGIGAQKTLTADSATPSVAGTSHAITANVNPTLYSNFTGGTAGQLLVIEVNDAVSTFDCIGSEATINCGGIDIAAAAGDILTWVYDGTIWNLVNWLDEGDAQTGADLAEYFGSTETLMPGDVVSADVTNPEYIRKSAGAYDSRLLGVVSTLPGLVIGDPNDLNQIALVGRVPVKVTNENGAVRAGDYLTSSSTKAGYAMKATKPGTVVGMALADFNSETGTVMTFVKATWFDPVEEQKRAVLAALGMGSGPVAPQVLGANTSSEVADEGTPDPTSAAFFGPAEDGSLGVLEEEVDLLVHGLLTANNLVVKNAATFEGALTVVGPATFEGDLVVKGTFATGSLELSGAVVRSMTAGGNISAGDPVVMSGANTVARAGSANANVVGLAATSAGAGSTVKVAVAGTVGGYGGLAVGSRYYLGEGGSVSTVPGGKDKAVHIGIAVSGSEMVVQIFEGPAPKVEAPVEDVAKVDPGPTINVEPSPTTTETPAASPSSTSSPEPSPAASPEPSPAASPSPTPAP